jgi:hypothetical protein
MWANHFELYPEFAHEADFDEHRNRIGGLLLLPKSFNASYGDLPYEKKLSHYFGQNLLAKSFHPRAYSHNPGFAKFVKQSGLGFEFHRHYKKKDFDKRQALYTKLAERVWSPDRLAEVAE